MITLQRRGIVDGYKGYSFARPSTAYGPDGKLYLPHNARFVPGPFPGSRALLVEEGTDNIVPLDRQKFVGWTARRLLRGGVG